MRSFRRQLALAVAFCGLAACGENDAPDDELNPQLGFEVARIAPAAEAISGAQVATLDPATMVDAEIRQVLGTGPRCLFRYTSSGKPVLAWSVPGPGDPREGAVKLNGRLVALRSAPGGEALEFAADRVRLMVAPDGGEPGGSRQQEATMIFEVRDSLRVGYRGYHACVD